MEEAAHVAETMAAVAALEGIWDRHGAELTESQLRELSQRLAIMGRKTFLRARKLEEAKAKAEGRRLYRDYCSYGENCGAHGGGEIVPCFACGFARTCWRHAAY